MPVPIPDSMLEVPCEPVGPGKTEATFKRGFTKNLGCIGLYKNSLDAIKQYNDEMKLLRIRIQGSTDGR